MCLFYFPYRMICKVSLAVLSGMVHYMLSGMVHYMLSGMVHYMLSGMVHYTTKADNGLVAGNVHVVSYQDVSMTNTAEKPSLTF